MILLNIQGLVLKYKDELKVGQHIEYKEINYIIYACLEMVNTKIFYAYQYDKIGELRRIIIDEDFWEYGSISTNIE